MAGDLILWRHPYLTKGDQLNIMTQLLRFSIIGIFTLLIFVAGVNTVQVSRIWRRELQKIEGAPVVCYESTFLFSNENRLAHLFEISWVSPIGKMGTTGVARRHRLRLHRGHADIIRCGKVPFKMSGTSRLGWDE